MRGPDVDILLDKGEVQPGEEVTGVVRIEPEGKVKSVHVELVETWCFNVPSPAMSMSDRFHAPTGDLFEHDAAVYETARASQDLPATGAEQRFAMILPLDAPPSVFDPTRPVPMQQLVSWQVRAKVTRGWAGSQAQMDVGLQVLSPSAEYAEWADDAPAIKSKKCPISVHPDSRVLRPGDPISGTIVVTPKESFEVERVTALLGYRRKDWEPQRGISQWSDETLCELSGPTRFEAGQTYTFPFAITLPDWAPPSYEAPDSDLHWFAVGEVKEKGLFAETHVGEIQFVVHTGGEGGVPAGTIEIGTATTVDELVAFVSGPPASGLPDRGLEDRKMDAVEKIAHSGDPRAVTALISLLDVDTGFLPKLSRTKETVGNTVIEQLGELRDPQAVDALIARLHADAALWRAPDRDGTHGRSTRRTMASDRFKAAAHALVEIGDPRAITALTVEWENKSNVFIRKSAKKAADALASKAGDHHRLVDVGNTPGDQGSQARRWLKLVP